MTDRLILEFLGIDLISNIARDIGQSLDQLGTRFDRLGAMADAKYRSMVDANRAANMAMKVQLSEMTSIQEEQDAQMVAARAAADKELNRLDDERLGHVRALNALTDATYTKTAEMTWVNTQLLKDQLAAQIAVDEAAIQTTKTVLTSNLAQMESERAKTDEWVAATRQMLASEKLQRDSALETARVTATANQARIQSMTRLGMASATVGAAALAMSAGIGIAMVAAANHAANFQAEMTLIETQAGAPRKGESINGVVQTAGEIEKIQNKLLDMLPIYGVTGVQAAKAMYHLESLGFRGAQALDILGAGLKGAKVGMADVEATVNVLGTVMASGISGIKDATDAMAQLDAFVGVGNMRMEDLNSAFTSGIVGAAQNFGVSLKDVGAALATLTDLGMPAAMAGTRLRMSMTLLGAPAKAATGILKTLGLTEEEAAAETTKMWKELQAAGVSVTKIGETMRTKGLIPALQLMKDAMTDAGLNADQQAAVISRAFGGGRSGAAIMTLIQNMDRLNNRFNQISRLQQTFEERWAETQATMKFQMEALHGAFDKFIIHLGLIFMPTVLSWIAGLRNVISAVADWMGKNEQLLARLAPLVMLLLAGVGAFFLVAGAVLVVGGALAALGGLAVPVALAIGAIMLAVAFMTTHWKDFVSFWHSDLEPLWTTMTRIVESVFLTLSLAYKTVVPGLIAAFKPLASALLEQGGLWDTIKTSAGQFLNDIKRMVNSPEFAALVAWLAVYIPAAVGIAIQALILAAHQAGATFAFITGVVKAGLQTMNHDYAGAAITLKQVWEQQGKDQVRITKEQNDLILAEYDIFGPKLAKKAQDLADQVKLGIDDILNPLPASVGASVGKINTILDDMKPNTKERARLLGEDLAAGLKHGVDVKAGEVAQSAAALVDAALEAARSHSRSSSPSMLFAEKLGVPIAQGVALGITTGAPGAATAMTGLIGSLVNLTPKIGPMTTSGGAPTSARADQEKQQQDVSDLLTRIATASETVAASCKTEHNTDQKPNSDRQALLNQLVASLDLKGVQTSNRGQRGYLP